MVQLEPMHEFLIEACCERVVFGAIRVSVEIETRRVEGGRDVGWIFVGTERREGVVGCWSWAGSFARRREVVRRRGVVSILRRRGAVGVEGRM